MKLLFLNMCDNLTNSLLKWWKLKTQNIEICFWDNKLNYGKNRKNAARMSDRSYKKDCLAFQYYFIADSKWRITFNKYLLYLKFTTKIENNN